MSRESRVMWFGSIFGGLIFFLFSAIGITQYYRNVDPNKNKEDQDSKDSSKK
ncbi:hypothetical protein [Bacillus sp. Marseille-Q3570]|uniref:hypothetical protein n=1 Tax=Bacillus sp. Marseille-Q3570 TaxID=2963522 RepID=UPI0021B75C6F|nr:hypothetical protein [Bacillus sp. Marseille-Q3570]